MNGFIEAAKITLKIMSFPLLILAIYAILSFNLTGGFADAISFFNSGIQTLFGVLNSVYRLVYYYTGGLFVFPFTLAVIGLGVKLSYAVAIFAIWGYKWYIRILGK